MKYAKLWGLGLSFAGLLAALNQSHSIQSFNDHIKKQTENSVMSEPFQIDTAAVTFAQNARTKEDAQKLLQQIKKEAAKKKIPAVDARLDRVWKAIPGYNGLEVDVEKTWKLAVEKPPAEPITYIMKEVPPSIVLKDLGAQPVYRANPDKKIASIMINVAWGNEYLPSILKTLEEENVRCTFFLDGSWLSKNKETALEIAKRGHELSNHAYSHKNMSQISRERAVQEISKTEKLLTGMGVRNTLFAPPSGDYDEETVQIAHEMKLTTVLWTVDTVDWKHPSPDSIVQKISRQTEPGALILMHPTDSASAALKGMIRSIKQKGLALGTVSEALSSDRIPAVETTSGF